MPDKDRPNRGGDVAGRGSKPLTPRSVGLLMALWTVLAAGWFMLVVADGTPRTAALVLAVGGLIGVVWLLGMLILGLFLITGE